MEAGRALASQAALRCRDHADAGLIRVSLWCNGDGEVRHGIGKRALVTGSSRGIGEAIASALAREGVVVVVHGRDRAATERVASSIVAKGGYAYAVLGDLTQDNAVTPLVEEAVRLAGGIDILVNNAGGSDGPKQSWDVTQLSGWASAYDRNVLGAVRVVTKVLPLMRRARWGRIINISSLAATITPATGPDYSASKAALNAMTASMAKAVAAEGVTVNAVSTGTIFSPTLEKRFREVARERTLVDEAASWEEIEHAVLPFFAQVPMGRVGRLEEIADVVTFLASPAAGYITGTNVRVDGGMSPSL